MSSSICPFRFAGGPCYLHKCMFSIKVKLYEGCKKIINEVDHNCVPIFMGLPFVSNSMCCVCFPEAKCVQDDLHFSYVEERVEGSLFLRL